MKKPQTGKQWYAEKLKDPRWQKKRLEAQEYHGWACGACLSEDLSLHVHHRWYMKDWDPWDYNPRQLEPLCEGCHARVEVKLQALRAALSHVPVRMLDCAITMLEALGEWQEDDPELKCIRDANLPEDMEFLRRSTLKILEPWLE